jgi:microcystin-dependent protein
MPFIGEIKSFGGDYAPSGWMKCNGDSLLISEHPDLFGVIGNNYGGDGITDFALPDLRGRVLIGSGQGQGLLNYNIGQKGGAEAVTLDLSEMPKHNHKVNAVIAKGGTNDPANNLLSNAEPFDHDFSTDSPDTQMSKEMLTEEGDSKPHENRPPFLVATAIICICGDYPFKKKCK